jgi:hypothetical protein
MRFIGWNLVFATWLLISAFALPQTPLSSAIAWVTAVLVATVALVSPGKPDARFVISALALMLAIAALLAPGVSGIAAINDALVAAALFALSMVKPVRHAAPAA